MAQHPTFIRKSYGNRRHGWGINIELRIVRTCENLYGTTRLWLVADIPGRSGEHPIHDRLASNSRWGDSGEAVCVPQLWLWLWLGLGLGLGLRLGVGVGVHCGIRAVRCPPRKTLAQLA